MAQWHLRSKKSPTGRAMSRLRKKRRQDRGSEFTETKIGSRKARTKRARGDTQKRRLLSVEKINVADPTTGKISRTTILSVESNPANPHYERRNILTRGAIVKTEAGLARITSRPGQQGIANGILLEEK